MPFWNDTQWRSITPGHEPIKPFDTGRIEDANYLLAIGNEVYVSASEGAGTARKLAIGESFSIDPGQFAYLLTEEEVTIPFDVIGFISIRASIKFYGLVNISGFHVDPGYSGKLLFSVFNAGPTRIHLKRGEPIFPIWLAELKGPISSKVQKNGYQDIPSKYISNISGNFTTAYQVAQQLDSIKDDVSRLKEFRLYAAVIMAAIALSVWPTIQRNVTDLLIDKPELGVTDEAMPTTTQDGDNSAP